MGRGAAPTRTRAFPAQWRAVSSRREPDHRMSGLQPEGIGWETAAPSPRPFQAKSIPLKSGVSGARIFRASGGGERSNGLSRSPPWLCLVALSDHEEPRQRTPRQEGESASGSRPVTGSTARKNQEEESPQRTRRRRSDRRRVDADGESAGGSRPTRREQGTSRRGAPGRRVPGTDSNAHGRALPDCSLFSLRPPRPPCALTVGVDPPAASPPSSCPLWFPWFGRTSKQRKDHAHAPPLLVRPAPAAAAAAFADAAAFFFELDRKSVV